MSRLLKTVVPLAAGMRGPLRKLQEKTLDTANHLLDITVHGAGWSAVRIAAAYRATHAFSTDVKSKLRHRLAHPASVKSPPSMAADTADSYAQQHAKAQQPMAVNNTRGVEPSHGLKDAFDISVAMPPEVHLERGSATEPVLRTGSDTPAVPSDQRARRAPERKTTQPRRWPTSWTFSLALVLGLLVGAAFTATAGWLWLRMPYAAEGADFNGDGIMDSTRTVSMSGHTLRIEIDRNMDDKIDRIQTTNLRGQIENSLSDDDFDGVFESQAWFSNGQLESSQTDADGDGFAEIRSYYPYGVKATTRHIDPKTHRDVRIEHFKLGVLVFAIEDIDRNGKINHRIDYSPTGQVLRTSKLKQQP